MNASKHITEMLIRMLQGDKLTMDDEKERYHCSTKTIQRYLRDIKDTIEESNFNVSYIHDLKRKEYYLKEQSDFSFEETLALLKIVIGTRAFNKTELEQLMDRLLNRLSVEDQPLAKKLISSTTSKYVPIKSDYDLLPRIKNFSKYISENTAIEFTYLNGLRQIKRDIELPISLYFDNFYFYVVTYNEKYNKNILHRLDRFQTIKPLPNKKIRLPWEIKKDDGKEINKTYLISDGKENNFELYYSGYPQTALDHFPNAKIKKELDGEVLIEGSAYMQGLILWIMEQGPRVRVKSPASLVEEVKSELLKTLKYYE
ncbi:helix-turn-helix transcriptional regulator [Companilactobacillus kedongensis]|uniref:helix-turn-helix transcriptional regulator n=1 Tax=Companilactobacillus kedongensis TaxID=2486004 RepID=UPI000F78A576|nr:WYL domain-containing protein [Companilactobacillus kedongensis]